jgi:hypothetical protein
MRATHLSFRMCEEAIQVSFLAEARTHRSRLAYEKPQGRVSWLYFTHG